MSDEHFGNIGILHVNSDLHLSTGSFDALRLLRERFGYAAFRGCQQDVVQRVLNGEHCLVIMATGGGKSLCYQIPALILAERSRATGNNRKSATDQTAAALTIVLSPLIALMKDQVDALRARGVDASFVNSSLQAEERRERYQQIRDGRFDLLYVTPERFRKQDFLACLPNATSGAMASSRSFAKQ